MDSLTDICKKVDALAVELSKTNDLEPMKSMWTWIKDNAHNYPKELWITNTKIIFRDYD